MWRNKLWYLAMAVTVALPMWAPSKLPAQAQSCPDLRVVFARGSGGTRWEDQNYLEFRDRLDEKLDTTGIDYEFIDLDYPAIGVGTEDLSVTVDAFLGAGDAYEFGDSVNTGVKNLVAMVNDGACAKTKYVIGGYSQGAMVVSKALHSLNASKIIYAATFGDPKIYLPEGKSLLAVNPLAPINGSEKNILKTGTIPVACKGENLSEYRNYVPDCYAYEGMLGSYRPYAPEGFDGKLGTWCNGKDIFCSSYLSVSAHTSYVSDNLYEDASRVVISKVTEAFGIESSYRSPHDTAILIDSTGSMSWMIDKFKDEAVRLANETFEAGGRVALYDYRDLNDPYAPVAKCTFENCTLENFQSHIDNIVVDGGGDWEESLLSASVTVMKELNWRPYATKSLVVLTDAPFLSPDRDATTVDDVVELSKRIDPVNIYIITDELVLAERPDVAMLAEATGGFATAKLGELDLLTDYIMERYDTLPRVEESATEAELPTIAVVDITDEGSTVTIKTNSGMTIVALNDGIIGTVSGDSIVIRNLDRGRKNTVRLIPISDSRKGAATEVVFEKLPIAEPSGESAHFEETSILALEDLPTGYGGTVIPKTPDTSVVH